MYPNYTNPYYMGTNSPYISPYQNRLESMQQTHTSQYQITRVNGKNGAEAFQMPPNSAILLLDETAPIVWLCQSDGAGYKTCTPYQIAPYQSQPEPDYNDLNKRITRLEEMINEQPHVADAKQKRSVKSSDQSGE